MATPRRGDLNGDGFVTGADLALLLARWGEDSLTHDLNLDGSVGSADLTILLSNWG